MRTDTFDHYDASVTVRERIGADDIDMPFIVSMIAGVVLPGVSLADMPNRVYLRCMLFAAMVRQQVEIKGDLGLTVPGPNAGDDALKAFYAEMFESSDSRRRELLDKWTASLNRVNNPPAAELHTKLNDPEQSSAASKSGKKSAKLSGGA
jgi:hypothetical protein